MVTCYMLTHLHFIQSSGKYRSSQKFLIFLTKNYKWEVDVNQFSNSVAHINGLKDMKRTQHKCGASVSLSQMCSYM